MIIEFIYNMALVILFILLSLRLKEHILKSSISNFFYYKIFIAIFASIIIIVLMKRPFVYQGVFFDLKSVPLLVISYIYGWKYGLVAASLPIGYRFFGGEKAVLGAIFFEMILAVIIGGVFHKKQEDDFIIVSVDKKRIMKLYFLLLFIGFGMFVLIYDYPLSFWVKVISTFSFFSLLTLLNSVILINDINQSIYHSIVEYENLRVDFIENKSELKRAKNKMDLIGKLSHEFKTPLNLIFSAVQMIKLYYVDNDDSTKSNINQRDNKEKMDEDKKVSKYINIITQNGYRMLRLVNNLIDLIKMDVDSFSLNFKNVNIVRLLNKITYSVEDYIDSKKRKVEFSSDISHKVIKCDPVNIERIVLNLLSNAVKFTEEGDKISVHLSERKDEVVISVKDSGLGMKEEKLNDIFDEFNQIDESLARNSDGSGLGLSIVKSLVEMHNGSVDVASEYGEGSEFIITLPGEKIEGEETKKIMIDDNLDRTAVELSDLSF